MGRLERIWVKRAHGGVMDERSTAALEKDQGIAGNADRGGRRQVTLVGRERWERAAHDLAADVDPALRRANFLVSGVDLADSRGRTILIGSCRLRVGGETRPCGLMDDAHEGLQDALDADWGGGAYAEVLVDGAVSVGDTVEWLA